MNPEFKAFADASTDISSFIDQHGFIRGTDVEAHRIATFSTGV